MTWPEAFVCAVALIVAGSVLLGLIAHVGYLISRRHPQPDPKPGRTPGRPDA